MAFTKALKRLGAPLGLVLLLNGVDFVRSFVPVANSHNDARKPMTLHWKQDDFTTGPFGQPASSIEEDIELTRKVILDHISKEMTELQKLDSKKRSKVMTATRTRMTSSMASSSSSTSASGSQATNPPYRKRVPSEKDAELTRQVILNHIAKQMSMGYQDPGTITTESSQPTTPSQPQAVQSKDPATPETKTDTASSPMSTPAVPSVRRAGVLGVSISPIGFLLLLATSHQTAPPPTSTIDQQKESHANSKVILPVRVSSPPNDAITTDSAEALTTIQLLWGIDMAGPVLGPTALQTLAALYCAEEEEDYDIQPSSSYVDECNPDKDDNCVISIEDELGLGLFDDISSSSSTLLSDPAGNLRLVGKDDTSVKSFVNDFISKSLPEGRTFDEAGKSSRASVEFPPMTLDQVRIEPAADEAVPTRNSHSSDTASTDTSLQPHPFKFVLEITVGDSDRLDIPLYSETTALQEHLSSLKTSTQKEMETSSYILRDMALSFDPDASGSFTAIALAMRYKAPITISSEALDIVLSQQHPSNKQSNDVGPTASSTAKTSAIVATQQDYNEAIGKHLPDWRSVSDLQSQSQRIERNIEQSFEVHKLQGALRIATEKGDAAAIEKIRAALEKFDTFDNNTDPTEASDTDENDNMDQFGGGPCNI